MHYRSCSGGATCILHYFRIHGKEYGCARVGGPSFDGEARHVPLVACASIEGSASAYIYNFIDHWNVSCAWKPCWRWTTTRTLSARAGTRRATRRLWWDVGLLQRVGPASFP